METFANETTNEQLAVASDVESIVTTFSKAMKIKYTSNNGWLELLQPLLALNMSKGNVYNCFSKIVNNYIPKCFNNSTDDEDDKVARGQPHHLLRLLLLYHDPDLCSFLDTRKITPDMYATSWVSLTAQLIC